MFKKFNKVFINNYNTSKLRSYILQLRGILDPKLKWYVSGGSVVRALIQKEIDSADIDIFSVHNPRWIASVIENDCDIYNKNKSCGEKSTSKPRNMKYFSQRLQKNLNIINSTYFNETHFDFDVCTTCIDYRDAIINARLNTANSFQNMRIQLRDYYPIYETFPFRYAKYKRMGFSFEEKVDNLFKDIMSKTDYMKHPEKYLFDTMNKYTSEVL